MRSKFAVVGCGVLALTGVASAQSVMYSVDFGPESVPFNQSAFASLPLFDPAIGDLVKVTLMLDADVDSGTISWDNEADVASDITLGIGAEVEATGLAGLAVVAIPLQTGSGQVDADNDGAADFLGTDAFSVTGGSGSDSDMTMATDMATLLAYTGVGSFDVDLQSSVETFLSSSGGFGPIDPVPGQTSGTVKVIYEYIPTPGAVALLGMGALAGMRRRR